MASVAPLAGFSFVTLRPSSSCSSDSPPKYWPHQNHTIGRAPHGDGSNHNPIRGVQPTDIIVIPVLPPISWLHQKLGPLGSLPIAKDLVGGVKLRCWWATGAKFPRPLGRFKFCPSSCNAWRVKKKSSTNAATDGRTCIFLMVPRLNSTLLHKHREGLRHQTRVRSSLTGNVFPEASTSP